MKRTLAFTLALALSLSLCAGSALADSQPLLYQVKDEAGHTLYLLGTIHVGDENMYPWSEAVENAYQDADILAVEIDLVSAVQDVESMLQYSIALMYDRADENAQQHLSPETFALGVEKLGQPEMALNRMRPAAWLSLAQEMVYRQAGLSSEMGMDMTLLNRAHEEGKTVHSLETMESQMDVLLGMSDALVDYQLQQFLLYPEAAAISIRLMAESWRQGNETLFSMILAQDKAAVPLEFADEYAQYLDLLYTQRDNAFEEKAKAYLASGETVLFAVGAAHIVGQDALAQRLAQAGYEVTEIGR